MKMIKELLEQRILVLDGAMGTMLQRHKLEEDDFRNESLADHVKPLQGNNDLLSITRPEIVQEVHESFLEAGADIIETNTFSGTTIAQADYDTEFLVDDINIESAKIAKKAVQKYNELTPEKPRFVAGALGPTNKTASISPDVNQPGFRAIDFEELKIAYRQQAEGLVEGGADILLVETVFDTLNAKAALVAITELKTEKALDIPVMLSGTITDASGRLLSGQTPEAFYISMQHFELLSIGFNCALGADKLLPSIERLARIAPSYISAYPNAGLPNAFGEYDETPEMMRKQLEQYLEKGLLNIVGGCCGTTPEHIGAITAIVKDYSPRPVTESIYA